MRDVARAVALARADTKAVAKIIEDESDLLIPPSPPFLEGSTGTVAPSFPRRNSILATAVNSIMAYFGIPIIDTGTDGTKDFVYARDTGYIYFNKAGWQSIETRLSAIEDFIANTYPNHTHDYDNNGTTNTTDGVN